MSSLIEAEHRGGSGTPLVLVHGITASFRVWQPVFGTLERHHEVIAPTLAGHYGAAPLDDSLRPNVKSLTDVLERRLDELEISKCHVAGNSLGGWIALELARRRRARSVVAFSPAGASRSARDLARVSLLVRAGHAVAGARAGRVPRLLARPRARRLLLKPACERGERLSVADVDAILTENAACTVLDSFLLALRDEGGLVGPVEADGCPIRIAWGTHDRTIPFERYGRPVMEAVPGAELVMLPSVGHVPMYDDPELVAQTILNVTEAVDAGASRPRAESVPAAPGAQTR